MTAAAAAGFGATAKCGRMTAHDDRGLRTVYVIKLKYCYDIHSTYAAAAARARV